MQWHATSRDLSCCFYQADVLLEHHPLRTAVEEDFELIQIFRTLPLQVRCRSGVPENNGRPLRISDLIYYRPLPFLTDDQGRSWPGESVLISPRRVVCCLLDASALYMALHSTSCVGTVVESTAFRTVMYPHVTNLSQTRYTSFHC